MKTGITVVLFLAQLFSLYVVLVFSKVNDTCSGTDASTCGSPSVNYICLSQRCSCRNNSFYVEDLNCIEYKEALPLASVEIVNISSSGFTVTWSKPEVYPGPMFYIIALYQKRSRDREIANDIMYSEVVEDYNTTEFYFDEDIVGFWTYRASVTVILLGNGEKSNQTFSQEITTPTTQPDFVQDPRALWYGDYTEVVITWACPSEKKQGGIITNFTLIIESDISDKKQVLNIPKEDYEQVGYPHQCSYSKTIQVTPATNYTIKIRANNEDYNGKEYVLQYYAKEGRPRLLSSSVIAYNPVSSTETSITIKYCWKCLLNNTNGNITYTAIIICHYNYCHDKALVIPDIDYVKKYTTWKQAKASSFEKPFIVTKGDWIQKSNDSDFSELVVGNEEGCEQKPEDVICNGPLEPDTAYRAIAVTCNRAGCVSNYDGFGNGWFRTQSKDNTVAIVAGILGTAAGISIMVAIYVIYQKGYCNRNKI